MYGNAGVSQYKQVELESAIFDVSPHQLIERLFQGANDNLMFSEEAIRLNQIDKRSLYINKVIAILDCLKGSLDHAHAPDMTRNLDALYDYMTWALIEANLNNDQHKIDEVKTILAELSYAWSQIAPSNDTTH